MIERTEEAMHGDWLRTTLALMRAMTWAGGCIAPFLVCGWLLTIVGRWRPRDKRAAGNDNARGSG